ncbi:MAG: TspO/MBR family protein [Mycobacteriaceae bacterium]
MDPKRLAFGVAPVLAAAVLGGLGSRNAPEVYGRLHKPRWAPPASVFGPVWTTLYVGIGVAGWRLYRSAPQRVRTLHLVQLALNAAWSPTFFGVRDKRASLFVISALDAAVAAEVAALRRADPVAAALLAPYLAWAGFATALNAAVSDPAAQR